MKNMHTHKWQKSVFSLLIVMAMIFSMLPASAFASDDAQDITLGDSIDVSTPATTDGGDVVAPASTPLGIAPAAAPVDGTTWTFTDASPDETDVSLGSGTYSWVQSSKTLTLNGVAFSTSAAVALQVPDGTTINVTDDSTITSTGTSSSSGIKALGELAINGIDGKTLTVSSGNCSSSSYGIEIASGGSLTMNSGTLNAIGGTAGVQSAGIGSTGSGASFIINGGTLNATGGTGGSQGSLGISGNTSLTMSGGTIVATGNTRVFLNAYTVPEGHSYWVSETTTPSNDELTGDNSTSIIGSTHKYAKITVSGGGGVAQRTKKLDFTANSVEKQADGTSWGNPTSTSINALDVEGWKWEYPAKILTIENLNLSVDDASYPAILLPIASTIVINGTDNTIEHTGNNAGILILGGKLTIEGDGELAVESNAGIGIKVGDLEVKGGTIFAKGGTSAVEITNNTVPTGVIVTTGANYTEAAAFVAGQGMGPPPPTATIKTGSTVVTDAKIAFVAPPDYTLFLDDATGNLYKNDTNGTDVTTDFAGTADVSGDPGARILTLNGLDFETTAAVALEVPAGTTITLVGTNEINHNNSNTSSGVLFGVGDMTFNGTGTLTMNTNGEYGIISYGGKIKINSGNIVITANTHANGRAIQAQDLEIAGGSLEANGTLYGIYVSGNVVMTSGDVTTTTTGGATNAFTCVGDFTISGGTVDATGVNCGLRIETTLDMSGGTIYAKGTDTSAAYIYGVDSDIVIKANGPEYTTDAVRDGVIIKLTPGGAVVFDAKITAAPPAYTLYYNSSNGGMFKNANLTDDEITTTDVPNWSGNGATLTLDGFDFETSAPVALVMPAGTTIVLNNNNTISAINGNGIMFEGSLTIQGTGTLDIQSKNGAIENVSNGTTLNVQGGDITATVTNDNGIETTDFTMSNGSLTVTTTSSNDAGIYVYGGDGFKMTGGTLTASGRDGIFAEDVDFEMTGGTITATGSRYGINADENFLVEGGDITATSQNGYAIKVNSNLTMNGGSIEAANPGSSMAGIDVGGNVLINDGSIEVTGDTNGFWIFGTFTVEDGSVIANGANRGIHCGGVGTLSGGSVTATGTYMGIYCNNNFIMDGGMLNATGDNDNGVYVRDDFSMSGGTIEAEGGTNAMAVEGSVPLLGVLNIKGHDGTGYNDAASFEYDDSEGATLIKDADGNAVLKAKITVPLGPLDFTTGVDQSGNGYVWDEATKTLTLTDFEMDIANTQDRAIRLPATATIVLNGDNSILTTSGYDAISAASGGTLTIQGTGSLDIATNGAGIVGDTITVESGTLDIAAFNAGIKSDTGINIEGGTVTINAGTNALYTNGDITVSDGTVTVNSETTSAIYVEYGGTFTVTGGSVTATTDDGASYGLNGAADVNVSVTGGTLTLEGGTYGMICKNYTMTGGTVFSKGSSNALMIKGTFTTGLSAKIGSAYTSSAVFVTDTFSGYTSIKTAATNGIDVTDAKITVASGTTYTVTYNGNGSTGGTVPTDSTQYASGATVTVKGNTGTLAKTGYTFGGWNTKADGTGTNYTAGTGTFTISANTTLYAKWTANDATTYTVTYNGNGNTSGTVPTDSNSPYNSGSTVTVLGNTGTLAKTGYAFAGWNTKADGTGTNYTAGTGTFTITANTTLYAKWTETYTVSGTVKDYLNANVDDATVTIMLGNDVVATTTTDASGTFSFANIIPGLYNLVIENGDQKITVIVTVTNASVSVPEASTKFPQYIQNSVVEVEATAPVQAVVGGLQEVYDTPVADNTKGFTEADIAAIESGATGEIKVVVDAIQATADQTTIRNAATGKTVDLFIDLSVFKTITPSGGSGTTTQLTELPGLLAVTFDLPTELQGKTITAIYRVHGGVVETITTSGTEYFSQNGNTITLHVKKFSTYGLAYTNANPQPTPTPSGGSSGGSSRQYTPAPNPWLEPTPAQTLATAAKKAQQDSIRTKSDNTYGVRKASWQKLKGYRYYHDTMAAGAVSVRLYIDNPAALTRDVYVTGFVKGSFVDNSKAMFEKWFTNKIRVIHMDEAGSWGQEVRIAAKVDLTGMDTNKLYFYSYDKKANKYTRITAPKYRIDKNGYLHFCTGLAGDIIVSNGALVKK